MGLFNNQDQEKEVSGGAVMGVVLLGLVAVLVIAFIIFAVVKMATGKKDDSASIQTSTVAVEMQLDTTFA